MRNLEFREDFPFLLNELNLKGVGVEVGVLRGEFSQHLLQYWQGQKLYCVDAWRHLEGVVDVNNPDHNGHLDNMAKAFMRLYGFKERATLIREESVAAANLFQDQSLSFVYIDAAHDYEHVKQDLDAWWRKIQPGGILAGHDYLDGEFAFGIFGVKRAVDEWAAHWGVSVHQTTLDGNFPSWLVRK